MKDPKDKPTIDAFAAEDYMVFPVNPDDFLDWLSEEIMVRKGISSSVDLIDFMHFTTGTFMINYEMLHKDAGSMH